MAKHRGRAPASMDDFQPFYRKNGLLWVPYKSGDDWHLHYVTPEKAWQAINFALPVLRDAGVVIPFAIAALKSKFG